MGTPNVPIGIGPPNNLSVTIYQGDSDLDLTTVTAVTLAVTRALDGSTMEWVANVLPSTTSELLEALYAFQQPAASGTFAFMAGSKTVTSSVPNAVPVGALIFPSSQPGVSYYVCAVSGTAITLAAKYTGATNSAATATYTQDVTVLGTYDIAVSMTVPGGSIPAYSVRINATPPQQTPQHAT